MNLNGKQAIAIIIAVLGVLIGSAAQLTDLFGQNVAKTLISSASLVNSILSSMLAVLSSQGSQVRDVLAMPGVEKIDVNERASATLAAIAIDPKQDKISPTPAAMREVTATAQGGDI